MDQSPTNNSMVKLLGISKVLAGMLVLGVVCFSSIFPSCSTANLSDAKVCTSLSGSECGSNETTFSAETPVIYCSAKLNNAPSDTKVTFEWKHDGESFGKVDVNSGGGVVSSSYKPPSTFPPGNYSVTLTIASDNSKPVIKEFTIH